MEPDELNSISGKILLEERNGALQVATQIDLLNDLLLKTPFTACTNHEGRDVEAKFFEVKDELTVIPF